MLFSTDNQGREVLLGLTFEETQFCVEQRLAYVRNHGRSVEEKARYRDLMSKHDFHRLLLQMTPDSEYEGRTG